MFAVSLEVKGEHAERQMRQTRDTVTAGFMVRSDRMLFVYCGANCTENK